MTAFDGDEVDQVTLSGEGTSIEDVLHEALDDDIVNELDINVRSRSAVEDADASTFS